MKVGVIGCGYVGLVTGAGFAETGNTVRCADVDADRVASLQRAEIPIFEPGLPEIVRRNLDAGRLSFSTNVTEMVAQSEIVFVGVGTPPKEDGGADLSAVDKVAETVRDSVARETILVLKSTVPVGTNLRVRRLVEGSKHPIHVVSNPEFLKEGAAVNDFMHPDRIVVGCAPDADDVFRKIERLYHPLCLNKSRVIRMDPASAELTKYVSNTMLAMRISFMNEIAALCEAVGADVHHVHHGVGSDTRIGTKFLYAGPGYGGSCFPKDVTALVHTGREHGVELELAVGTHRVNMRQRGLLARKVKRHFEGDVRNRKIGIWGVAFKPRTDDTRESPAIPLIDSLVSDGAIITLHDPKAIEGAKARFGDRIRYVDEAYSAAEGADALVLVTEWREYQNPNFERLSEIMVGNLLVDGRNIWSNYPLAQHGFVYESVGAVGN